MTTLTAQQRLLLLPTLLMLITCCSMSAASSDVSPQTVTDQYGNSADELSDVLFVDIPASVTYEYQTSPDEYSYNGLLPLFNAMHGFVNACFGADDPYDLVLDLITGSAAIGVDIFLQLGKWGWGYAACVVVGLGFILIFPIVGMCFCCCRVCCKRCGGKMEQKRSDKTDICRACLFTSLFISCAFLGCGAICTFVVNERMTTLFNDITTSIDANVADFERYLNNTIREINYAAYDGFNFTAKVMIRDLDNIGPLVGGAVEKELDQQAGVYNAFDELLDMDPLLKTMIDGLTSVETSSAAVTSSITALDTAMTNAADDIDATFTSCGAPCSSNRPDLSALRAGTNFDPSTMPSFNTELNDLNNVYNENITALVLDGRQEFSNISGIVQAEAASTVQTLKGMINTFDDQLSTSLEGVNDMFSLFTAITNITDSLSGLESTELVAGLTLSSLENYRWMGGVGLTCFVLLIFGLQLFGVICGCAACCCCGDKKALPTARSGTGNCAGLCLMASVGFVFIFGSIICLLVWVLYLVGAPMERIVCQNFRDPELTVVEQLLDGGDPANGPYTTLLGEQDGYWLGEMMYQNSSVPLTLKGLLTNCRDNKGAWEALQLDQLQAFDLDDMLNYKNTVDLDGQIDSLNVSLASIEVIDTKTKSELQSMANAIRRIDFAGMKTSLSVDTVTVDFATLTGSLQTTANALPNGDPTRADLENHITTLNNIESTEVAAVQLSQNNMLNTVVAVETSSAGTPTRIDQLIQLLEDMQTTIQNNGQDIVKNKSLDYAHRVVGVADQYVSFVNTTIREDLGRCLPIHNFYQNVVINLVCGSILDSMNTTWFSLGWCLFFMVLGIILSTKLAKHVRRMETLHADDQSAKQQKGNKVHAVA